MPESEVRRRRAAALYETETTIREEGWPSGVFVYDDEYDLYRFADGEFAFSTKYANERRLREMASSSNVHRPSFGTSLPFSVSVHILI
jgi:hypothetical protein